MASFLPLILLSTSGLIDNHSIKLPTMVKITLYLVLFSTPGRVPTSIYNRRDYRPSAIRRQEHIKSSSFRCVIQLHLLSSSSVETVIADCNTHSVFPQSEVLFLFPQSSACHTERFNDEPKNTNCVG